MLKLIVVVTWVLSGRPQAMELRVTDQFGYHEACEARGNDVAERAIRAIRRIHPKARNVTASLECSMPEDREA